MNCGREDCDVVFHDGAVTTGVAIAIRSRSPSTLPAQRQRGGGAEGGRVLSEERPAVRALAALRRGSAGKTLERNVIVQVSVERRWLGTRCGRVRLPPPNRPRRAKPPPTRAPSPRLSEQTSSPRNFWSTTRSNIVVARDLHCGSDWPSRSDFEPCAIALGDAPRFSLKMTHRCHSVPLGGCRPVQSSFRTWPRANLTISPPLLSETRLLIVAEMADQDHLVTPAICLSQCFGRHLAKLLFGRREPLRACARRESRANRSHVISSQRPPGRRKVRAWKFRTPASEVIGPAHLLQSATPLPASTTQARDKSRCTEERLDRDARAEAQQGQRARPERHAGHCPAESSRIPAVHNAA